MANISSLLEKDNNHKHILTIAGQVGKGLNMETYVVGGFVRDALLDIKNSDIDIMVEGDAIKFAESFSKKIGGGSVVAFEKFGTALVPYNGMEIEIASAREEIYSKESRKPDISFTTVNGDMSRRDFTINAIAASIMPDNFGDLHDPFEGIKDLHRGLIITPTDPDKTFDDDPLRMLRAIRFASQLKFDIAPNILDSISRIKERIEIVSGERVTEEIIKLLKTSKPSKGFYLLKETGMLGLILPEFDIMSGVETIGGMGHKDVFIHTLQVIDNASELSNKMEIRFAALVHDIAKPQTKKFYQGKGWTYHGHEILGMKIMKKLARRMKISNELREYLMKMIKLHLRPIALAKEGVTDKAIRRLIVEAGDDIDDLMVLCRADITTKNPNKVKKYLKNFDRVEKLVSNVQLRDELRSFQSPVRGEEIMKTLKLKPGREIGQIKSAIEEAILDGEIENNYESAFDYMMKNKEKILSN